MRALDEKSAARVTPAMTTMPSSSPKLADQRLPPAARPRRSCRRGIPWRSASCLPLGRWAISTRSSASIRRRRPRSFKRGSPAVFDDPSLCIGSSSLHCLLGGAERESNSKSRMREAHRLRRRSFGPSLSSQSSRIIATKQSMVAGSRSATVSPFGLNSRDSHLTPTVMAGTSRTAVRLILLAMSARH